MMVAALEQAGEDAGAPKLLQRADLDLRDSRHVALRRSRARDRAPARRHARRDRRHALRRELLAGLRDRCGAPDPGGAPRGRRWSPAPRMVAAQDRPSAWASRFAETEAPGVPDRKRRRGQADLPRGRARARHEQRQRRLRRDRERDPLREAARRSRPTQRGSPRSGRASARSPAAIPTPGSASPTRPRRSAGLRPTTR